MKNEFDYLNDVKTDFSVYGEIELTDTERVKMKNIIKKNKKLNRGKIIGLAACVAVAAVFSQTVFAKELFGTILKTFTTGHNQFALVDTDGMSVKLPECAIGLIFDKDGNKVTEFKKDTDYYDKDGKKIDDYEMFMKSNFPDGITMHTEDGDIMISFAEQDNNDPLENAKKFGYPIIHDIEKINSYLNFEAQLPQYLPEGFTFYGASAYGTDYLFVYYMNDKGEYLMLDERIINDETAYSSATEGTIEEIEINGSKAVIMDKRSINWECGGISIGFNGRGVISEDELIKVANSIK